MNGGRLTLSAGVPYLNSDIIGQTLVSYSPVCGDNIRTPSGDVSFLSGPTDQCGLSLNLAASSSSWEAGAIYDLGMMLIGGVPALCASPKWTDSHTRSWALTCSSGIRVNAASMTVRHSSGTTTASAAAWTYLGTMQIDATAGQVSAHASFGQARKWGIWNAYNQAPIILQAGEVDRGPFNPHYGSTNFGPTHQNANNCLTVLIGTAQSPIEIVYNQALWVEYGYDTASAQIETAIGWDQTFPCDEDHTIGIWGMIDGEKWENTSGQLALGCMQTARAIVVPQIGSSRATALERFIFAANHTSLLPGNDGRFYSGTMNMLLTAKWMG